MAFLFLPMYDETHDEDDFDLAGSLLLAHPHLKDPHFRQTVVLMTAHEEEGSMGVILNRDTGKTLGDLGPQFAECGLGAVPVFVGGPVNTEQIILAAWKALPESGEFKLYFGMEPLIAQSKLLADPDLEFRAFRGYSGWGKGQLLGELEDNAWVVVDMDVEALKEQGGSELWRRLVIEANPELGLLSLQPDEPEAN